MPRPPRADEAGGLYHALNRGNSRAEIFRKEADFEAFGGRQTRRDSLIRLGDRLPARRSGADDPVAEPGIHRRSERHRNGRASRLVECLRRCQSHHVFRPGLRDRNFAKLFLHARKSGIDHKNGCGGPCQRTDSGGRPQHVGDSGRDHRSGRRWRCSVSASRFPALEHQPVRRLLPGSVAKGPQGRTTTKPITDTTS